MALDILKTTIQYCCALEGPFYSVFIISSVTLSSLTEYRRSTIPGIINSPLKLVSTIFREIFIFHQMIALQKL